MAGPCLSIILAALATSIAAVTLPELSREFQGTGIDPTLVVSIYVLATTAFIVPAGRAGDLFGNRKVLVGGLFVYVLGTIPAAQATTIEMLIAGRFVQGIGAASMLAMPLALVRDLVPAGQVGRWMGAIGTMTAIGTASGPALGGLVVDIVGWRVVYEMQIPAALVAVALCLILIRDRKTHDAQTGFDLPGAISLALFLSALTLLFSGTGTNSNINSVILLMIMAIAFAAFLAFESRSRSPIIPLNLLRSAHLSYSLAMNAIMSLIMMGILVVGPFFLVDGLGLTSAQMGLAMSVGPISAALSGIPAGRLTERLKAGRAVLVGASAMVVGTAAMAFLPYFFGLGGFVLAFLILAPSYQLFLAALNTSVMERAPEHERGVASGLLNLSRNIGFVLGAGLVSKVFWSLTISDTPIGAHIISFAMAGTFAGSAALSLCVVALAIFMLRHSRSK